MRPVQNPEVCLRDVMFTKTIFEKDDDWGVSMYTSRSFRDFPESVRKDNVKGTVCYFMATGLGLPHERFVKIDLMGRWKRTRYGEQFAVQSYEIKIPSTEEEILNFLQSGAIKGIGKVTAKRVVEAFGTETLDVMSRSPERLLSVRGVREDMLGRIKESVGLRIGYQNLQALLSPAGFPPLKTGDVYRELGDFAAADIRKNPYILMDVKGIGFFLADRVAKNLGTTPDSRGRLIAALRFSARAESNKTGDVFIHRDRLITIALQLCNDHAKDPVGRERMERVLEDAQKTELIWRFPGTVDAVYLPEADSAERSVAEAIVKMVKSSKRDDAWLAAVDDWIKKNQDIHLTRGQEEAVREACGNRIIVITGGAGTGKTTVAKAIMQSYRMAHDDKNITLLAPTGKAARRLSESTGEYACTIHSALKMQSGAGFLYYKDPLPEGLVVVDESSMVDIYVMQALMSAIAPGSTLVLLGDVNQLPSVGAGAVLGELIRSQKVKAVYLTEIMRQGKDSRIIRNSRKINEGDTRIEYGDDFCFIYVDKQNAQETVLKTYLLETQQYGMDHVVILSPLKKWGDVSCTALNRAVQAQVIPPGESRETCHGTVFCVGDKIIQTRNTETVSNGDVGYITSITSEYNEDDQRTDTIFRITFESGAAVRYTRKEMEDIDLAYCLTIHKSQGSEYKSVIIPLLMDYKCPLYKRNLLYTAVTRSKQKVTIIGHTDAIDLCIHTPDTGVRNTLLANRIYLMLER